MFGVEPEVETEAWLVGPRNPGKLLETRSDICFKAEVEPCLGLRPWLKTASMARQSLETTWKQAVEIILWELSGGKVIFEKPAFHWVLSFTK